MQMGKLAALFAIALTTAATMPSGSARAIGFFSFGIGSPGGGLSMMVPPAPPNANPAFSIRYGNAHQVFGLATPSKPKKTNSVILFMGLVPSVDSPIQQGSSLSSNAQPVANVIETSSTPLPAALPLFASALAGFGLFSWLRRRRAAGA
jgi:hypothetical protein